MNLIRMNLLISFGGKKMFWKDGEVLTCSKVWDHVKHSLPSLGLSITETEAVSLLQRRSPKAALGLEVGFWTRTCRE